HPEFHQRPIPGLLISTIPHQRNRPTASDKPVTQYLRRHCRIYAKVSEIKRVKGGYGISVLSTSKGLMTNKKARRLKLGGEIICAVRNLERVLKPREVSAS
ncbi:MAG: 30S ribosomal protein S8, partial [Kofleriaceae bacterium]|nr:30S ribosomal protein S8 [Kofleriaceae bacterium]